jgi:two-component system nitrate/nitrite response regulator NarL
MRRTRILVADSLAIFRSGVRTLLDRESDFEVVDVGSFDELGRAIEDDCPDIALIDLDLPPRGGVDAIARLTARCHCHTIAWSFDPDRDTVLAAIRAGADGYLDKRISPAGLVRAVRGVVRGEAPLSRDLASMMIQALHGAEQQSRAREKGMVLSLRERQVLELIAVGAKNKEIAERLVISEFTVKRHVQNILGKLELPSRRAAGAFYRSAFGAERQDASALAGVG